MAVVWADSVLVCKLVGESKGLLSQPLFPVGLQALMRSVTVSVGGSVNGSELGRGASTKARVCGGVACEKRGLIVSGDVRVASGRCAGVMRGPV
jgi:hypothetical protein